MGATTCVKVRFGGLGIVSILRGMYSGAYSVYSGIYAVHARVGQRPMSDRVEDSGGFSEYGGLLERKLVGWWGVRLLLWRRVVAEGLCVCVCVCALGWAGLGCAVRFREGIICVKRTIRQGREINGEAIRCCCDFLFGKPGNWN